MEAPIREATKKKILYLEQKALKKATKVIAMKDTDRAKGAPTLAQEKPGATQHLKRTKRGHHPSSKASRASQRSRIENVAPGDKVEEDGRPSSPSPSNATITAMPIHQAAPPGCWCSLLTDFTLVYLK